MDLDYFSKANAVVGVSEGGKNFDVVDGKAVLNAKNKNDKGGPTAYGITWQTLNAAYASQQVSHNDITKLTKAEADLIYRARYWIPSKAGQMPWGLCLIHYDNAVNAGVGQAAKHLQQAINACGGGINVDGKIGPLTLAAMNACNQQKLEGEYLGIRAQFYKNIASRNPAQNAFLKGWLNRIERVKNAISQT